MPIRIREATDLVGCVTALRRVYEASGYPSRWPDDPGGWLTPRGQVAAWVAEHDGVIAGHAALVRAGTQLATWVNADGTTPVVRCYVRPQPSAQGRAEAGGREPG